MIKDKRILLLCRESYSIPMYFLARYLRNLNTVATFHVSLFDFSFSKNGYTKYYYHTFKDLDNVVSYDLLDLANEFVANYESPNIDYEYLRQIERNYTHFKNLNLQLLSAQFTSRSFHYRSRLSYTTFEQNLFFLQLYYKKLLSLLEEFRPDAILDIEDADLSRTIINEIAYSMGIPYIVTDHSRYETYRLPTFTLGLKQEQFFKHTYNECRKMPESELAESLSYVDAYRNSDSIMSKEYSYNRTSQSKPEPWIVYIKRILFLYLSARNHNKTLLPQFRRISKKGLIHGPYSGKNSFFRYCYECERRRRKLFRKNPFFVNPDPNDTYVYMPLHMIPESTTMVLAPFYINELHNIQQVSKSLPIDWHLYVKEHPAMLGERPLEFYKQVNNLPNVKLIQTNYYHDPKQLIENSRGVITITGTSAYEAAMLSKPSIVLGHTPFNVIPSVHRLMSFEELPSLLRSFIDVDTRLSCAAYIEAVKRTGSNIHIFELISEGEKCIRNLDDIPAEYMDKIEGLADFYEKAFALYCDEYIDANKQH